MRMNFFFDFWIAVFRVAMDLGFDLKRVIFFEIV